MSSKRDELTRIDSHGIAHPIGPVASQRLRQHVGDYRVLPSPKHVVMMRYTGEDGEVDEGDGALVRIAGEIAAKGTMCDILALLAQTGWRGILSVHQGNVTREIYLSHGNVVGVKSTDPDERLGRIMYRYGHISEEDLHGLEEAVGLGRRFGEVAVDLEMVTREQVYKAFCQQITEVVVAALRVADANALIAEVAGLLDDAARRRSMREAALAFHAAHRGATDRLWAWLSARTK